MLWAITRKFRLFTPFLGILLLSACTDAVKPIAKAEHAAQGVLAADISRDGQFAVVATVHSGVGFWDLKRNVLLYQWDHGDKGQGGITAVDISPDNSRVITADRRTFVIWNANQGFAYGYWQAPADIRDVAVSDKGRYVLLGLGDGRVIHIDMTTGRRLEFLGHGERAVSSVDMSPNGLWALSGGHDYRAILWNTKTGKPKRLFEHDSRVVKVVLDSKGQYAFTAGTMGNALIWDLQTGRQVSRLKLKPREYVIAAARFAHQKQWIATGSPGRLIKVWDILSGDLLYQFYASPRQQGKPSGAIVYALAFSEDDRRLMSESSAGFGEIWDLSVNPKPQ